MNIFKPSCQDKTGKLLFIIFEALSLFIGVVMLIVAIYNSAITKSFIVFLTGFISALFYMAVVYGIGKIIDLLHSRQENKTEKENEE